MKKYLVFFIFVYMSINGKTLLRRNMVSAALVQDELQTFPPPPPINNNN